MTATTGDHNWGKGGSGGDAAASSFPPPSFYKPTLEVIPSAARNLLRFAKRQESPALFVEQTLE